MSNLANPGTHDATLGADPPWNTSDGWMFDSDHWLQAGTIIPDSTYSFFAAFTGFTARANNALCGMRTDADKNHFIWQHATALGGSCKSLTGSTNTHATGVAGMAGPLCYVNSSNTGAPGTDYSGATKYMRLGYVEGIYAGSVNIQAFAIYDVTLTSDQVAELTSDMAAL